MGTEAKHTPGPWRALTDDFGYIYDDAYCVIDDGSKVIAYVLLRDRPRNRDIAGWEANARVLAAAPDMLEALTGLVRKFEETNPMRTGNFHVNCDCLRCKFDAARAAIAKAEG